MMVLAMVILAGTSAWAQTEADPDLHFPGAQKTFSISASAGATSWAVLTYDATGPSTGATSAADCAPQAQAAGATADDSEFTITWAETASGTYIIRCTDTDADGCTTVRDYYVTVANFDVYVYACDAAGDRISAAAPLSDDMSTCGEANADYTPFDNENAMVFTSETITDPAPLDGSLTDVLGTSSLNQRYVAVEVSSSDVSLAGIDYWWQFDFTIVGDADGDFVRAVPQTAGATVNADGASFITVDPVPDGSGGYLGMRTKIVIRLDFQARWGTDVDLAFDIAANNTRMSDDGTTFNDGEEASSKYQNTIFVEAGDGNGYKSNRSENQTILGAPATSIISSSN